MNEVFTLKGYSQAGVLQKTIQVQGRENAIRLGWFWWRTMQMKVFVYQGAVK